MTRSTSAMTKMRSQPKNDDGDDSGSDVVVSKGQCPKCGADGALVTYGDGHVHCFNPACAHHTRAGSVSAVDQPALKPVINKLVAGDPITRAERGILPETFRRFGYTQGHYGKAASPVHIWTIFDQSGKAAFQKLRFLGNKDFVSLRVGDTPDGPNECQLWGRHVWGDQHDKRVVITEGEIDAMSVAQAADFKYPVVSVNGGAASAAKTLKANYRWLDRFSEIILWLDSDDAGQQALAECAPLFASGKVKVAKVEGYKDANEVLVAKEKSKIELAIYGATLWAPAGIVNAADAAGLLMADEAVPMWSFPYAELQAVTKGCRRGEIYFHVAGTGSGKSSVLNEYIDHWMFGEGHTEARAKIGIMAFETLLRETQLGILSVHTSKRLHLDPIPKDAMARLHAEVFGDRRVELFDPETAEWGFEPLIGYMRFLVRACDCNILIVDPLSFVAAQLSEADERRALDRVTVILAKLSKELNCAIHIAHHLTRPEGTAHEEGGQISLKHIRGSGGIAMFANGCLAYERNQQAEGDAKLVTLVRSLKWRWTGYTGVACHTIYNEENGRTTEISAVEAARLTGGEAPSHTPTVRPSGPTEGDEY